jgi:hypothetical protein
VPINALGKTDAERHRSAGRGSLANVVEPVFWGRVSMLTAKHRPG